MRTTSSLAFGSQDRFTLFTPVYSAVASGIGLAHAAAVLTLLLQAANILAAWSIEAAAIAKVVNDFRAALPAAQVFLYDNNSTDGTAEVTAHAPRYLSPQVAVLCRARSHGQDRS